MNKTWVLIGLVCFVPVVNGAPATSGGSGTGSLEHCFYYDVTGVAGVIAAGQIGICAEYPESVSSNTATFYIGGNAMAPGTISGTTTFTWSTSGLNGCTAGSLTSTSTSTGATSGSSTYAVITMTSNECRGVLRVTIAAGAVPVTEMVHDEAFNVQVPFQHVDNLNRLCQESAFDASCTDPTMNIAVSQSGNWQIDNLNRLCNESSFGAACNDPALNIASWPDLNVHQDEACGATIVCKTNSTVNMTIGNQTVMQTENSIVHFADLLVYLPFVIGVVLLFAGEMRKDNVYKVGAGLCFVWTGVVVPMDLATRIIPIVLGIYMASHYWIAQTARSETK